MLMILTGCCANSTATCQNEASDSSGSATIKATSMKSEMACKLTTPELRKRKEEVIEVLKLKILKKVELQNGYRFYFEGTDEILDSLNSFVKTERLCCDFFNFSILVSNDSTAALEITGDEGVKEFIKMELGM